LRHCRYPFLVVILRAAEDLLLVLAVACFVLCRHSDPEPAEGEEPLYFVFAVACSFIAPKPGQAHKPSNPIKTNRITLAQELLPFS
jgi:hypothetical protein